MAHNSLTGTVIAPTYFGPGSGPGTNIISGTLRGDGTDIVYVPRVSNASNNGVITNVGGDANTLTSETNLTFDGDTLSVTGDLTASIGISASYYWGDGSNLVGIGAASVSGSARHYSVTGLETSGYLKVSGASTFGGNLVPSEADAHDLGTAAKPWRNLYVSSSTIYFGTDTLSVGPDNNLKFGSGSTTKGFDVGFMNFKNNGIFMDPGRLFKLRAYQIQMFGGIGYVRKVVADDYDIQEIDYLIGIQSDSLTASVTLTLPAASGLLNGQTYLIKDEGGSIDVHSVVVSIQGDDTIDGQNQVVLESPYASIQIYCNGISKYFIC